MFAAIFIISIHVSYSFRDVVIVVAYGYMRRVTATALVCTVQVLGS